MSIYEIVDQDKEPDPFDHRFSHGKQALTKVIEYTDEKQFCPYCGQKLVDTYRFCPKCGKDID